MLLQEMKNINSHSYGRQMRKFSSQIEQAAIRNTKTTLNLNRNFRQGRISEPVDHFEMGKVPIGNLEDKQGTKTVRFPQRDQMKEGHIASLEAQLKKSYNQLQLYKQTILSFVNLIQENSSPPSVIEHHQASNIKLSDNNFFKIRTKTQQQQNSHNISQRMSQLENKVHLLFIQNGNNYRANISLKERLIGQNDISQMKYELQNIKKQQQLEEMSEIPLNEKHEEQKYRMKVRQCQTKINNYEVLVNKLFTYIEQNIREDPWRNENREDPWRNENNPISKEGYSGIQNIPQLKAQNLSLLSSNRKFLLVLEKQRADLQQTIKGKDEMIQNLKEELYQLSKKQRSNAVDKNLKLMIDQKVCHQSKLVQVDNFELDYRITPDGLHKQENDKQGKIWLQALIVKLTTEKRDLQLGLIDSQDKLANCQKYFKKEIESLHRENRQLTEQLKKSKVLQEGFSKQLMKNNEAHKQQLQTVRAAKVMIAELETLYRQVVQKAQKESNELNSSIHNLKTTNATLTEELQIRKTIPNMRDTIPIMRDTSPNMRDTIPRQNSKVQIHF